MGLGFTGGLFPFLLRGRILSNRPAPFLFKGWSPQRGSFKTFCRDFFFGHSFWIVFCLYSEHFHKNAVFTPHLFPPKIASRGIQRPYAIRTRWMGFGWPFGFEEDEGRLPVICDSWGAYAFGGL